MRLVRLKPSLLPNKKNSNRLIHAGIQRETECRSVFLTRKVLPLTPETAFQFTGKYRMYPPACLSALQKKKKDVEE